MKLYKFRSLGNEEDLERVIDILNESKFWHSKFSNLNDPVEGSFTIHPNVNGLTRDVIDAVYKNKNNIFICSFSGKSAFSKPLMWGHYANGFKGIAIEIEVDSEEVVKMEYTKEISHLKNNTNTMRSAKKILSNKLMPWKIENEYRSLRKMEKSGLLNVGKITAIYFGDPYRRADNVAGIYADSDNLREFEKMKQELIKKTVDIKSYSVKIEDCKVKKYEKLN
jgi:hypothetical protein